MEKKDALKKWFSDRGDYTHNINYDLNDQSVIIDFGGYTGIWAQQMIEKYNPYVYIVETVPEFYNNLVNKFKNNKKVQILNVGVSDKEEIKSIYVRGDATSTNFHNGNKINTKFKNIDYLIDYWKLNKIDLLQINIEGDEYKLLEYMIENNTLFDKIKNIQIQYHLGIDDCVNRRKNIQENLSLNGYKKMFDYPFVWESWKK